MNLKKLQAAKLPRLTWQDVFSQAEGGEPLSESDQAALDEYFGRFIAPQKNDFGHSVCVSCRKQIRGGIEGFFMGGSPDSTSMEWSLTHGECHCHKCGWPARAYHFDIGAKDNPIIKRLNLVLQFHPDELQGK